MKEKEMTLQNKEGLHARAAAIFVRCANGFSSDINLKAHGDTVNGKSIIGIMSLGAYSGEKITIQADGPDEVEAVDSLAKLIEDNFEM